MYSCLIYYYTAFVHFAATLIEKYYEEVGMEDASIPEMSDEETFIEMITDTLSPAVGERQNNAFLVAGKWALRARQLQNRPEDERLQHFISTAWEWVRMNKHLPKNMGVDPKMEILKHIIGHMEKRLQLKLGV